MARHFTDCVCNARNYGSACRLAKSLSLLQQRTNPLIEGIPLELFKHTAFILEHSMSFNMFVTLVPKFPLVVVSILHDDRLYRIPIMGQRSNRISKRHVDEYTFFTQKGILA